MAWLVARGYASIIERGFHPQKYSRGSGCNIVSATYPSRPPCGAGAPPKRRRRLSSLPPKPRTEIALPCCRPQELSTKLLYSRSRHAIPPRRTAQCRLQTGASSLLSSAFGSFRAAALSPPPSLRRAPLAPTAPSASASAPVSHVDGSSHRLCVRRRPMRGSGSIGGGRSEERGGKAGAGAESARAPRVRCGAGRLGSASRRRRTPAVAGAAGGVSSALARGARIALVVASGSAAAAAGCKLRALAPPVL